MTTPLTFVATASSAALLGARIVFADVEEDTGNLDPQAAKAALTERTRVVAAVDYAGHPAEMRPAACRGRRRGRTAAGGRGALDRLDATTAARSARWPT